MLMSCNTRFFPQKTITTPLDKIKFLDSLDFIQGCSVDLHFILRRKKRWRSYFTKSGFPLNFLLVSLKKMIYIQFSPQSKQ